MEMLRRVVLTGFKSIKSMDLELKPLNVLIGANGAGKTNFVSFFKMLNEMMGGRLQQYVATSGRAHSLLHYGPKVSTPRRRAIGVRRSNMVWPPMYLSLACVAGDTLTVADETVAMEQGGL